MQKTGHFAALCFQKRKNVVCDTANALQGPTQKSRDFSMTLRVNGTECRGLLDTVATRTLITKDV